MKNKKLLMLISVITIISFIIGVSYAYFTTIVVGNDTASSNVTTSGSLKLSYNGTDYIDMTNKEPGDYDSMTFTVKNTGTLPVSGYDIYFSNVINTFNNKSELVYEIDCTSSDAVTCLDKVETEVPSVSGIVLSQSSIAPGTTHTYTLTVTFTETGLNQDYNQAKTIYFDVTINEQYDIPVLTASTGGSDTRYFWGYKTSITSITFESGIDVPVGAYESWDVSSSQDGSIMSYIIDDGLGNNTYELFIQTNSDLILANENSSYLFAYFYDVTAINNLTMLNTSKVTNMEYMFYDCIELVELDVNHFDTSNVTNMSYMFFDLNAVTSISFDKIDTSNVTNMCAMFSYLIVLTSLDVSTLDTSKVTDMSNMFSGNYALETINLSTFDTSSVTDMSNMFYGCGDLTILDISIFDTSNVVSMSNMFSGCGITSLDLSNFDTSNVTNMSRMFWYCNSLANLNLSTFDTSNVTDMSEMFRDCTSLTSLDFKNANFTTVTTYTSMFSNITNGINIVVKDATAQTWITSRLTNAGKTGNVTIYVP